MANAFYTAYKQNLGLELHHMTADEFRAILVDAADYTFSAAHDFLDDIIAGARVALSAALPSLSWVGGVFDTGDFSWPTVSGDQAENIVIVNYNGAGAAADAARQLVIFYDTGMTGMPVTPSGGNINVTVHASGWFTL